MNTFAVTYRAIWRWHFYAGLFSIPFVLWLAVSGAIYLFRPQIEQFLDRPYEHLVDHGSRAAPAAEVLAALKSMPGARFHYYELPRSQTAAAQIVVGRGAKEFRVYVHPQTLQVLKVVDEDKRPMNLLFYLHGELLLGGRGSNIVELAASWTIILLVTGMYLWWPRQTERLAGVLYVRVKRGARTFWRDLHAVTGIWISTYALLILLTGLPWANFWGEYLLTVRTFAATHLVRQNWGTGKDFEISQRKARDASSMAGMKMGSTARTEDKDEGAEYEPLDLLVPESAALHLDPPVRVAPPSHPGDPWTVRSDSQNRPRHVTLSLDPGTGAILKREPFSQLPVVDRIVDTGVAMHEGQLFGLANQLLGLATALGLITLSLSAIVLWWRRRDVGVLGAPVPIGKPRWSFLLVTTVVGLGVYLPAMAISLCAVLLLEKFVFSRVPAMNRWFGLTAS